MSAPTAATQPVRRREPEPESSRLARRVIRRVAIAIPVMVLVWVGVIAIALRDTAGSIVAPLAMGAAVGVLAGLFWGMWWGVVSFSRDDRNAPTGEHT